MDPEHAITANPPTAPSHAITEHPHGAAAPFTDAEIHSLHSQDIAAGRAVVVLMCSIFLLGVFIYSVVACSIMF
jgi:hypothetical protein